MEARVKRNIFSSSFFGGMARALDAYGTCRKTIPSIRGTSSDSEMLRSDWSNVGQDIYRAISKYEQERQK